MAGRLPLQLRVEGKSHVRTVGWAVWFSLLPWTARRFVVSDSFDPTQNVEGGVSVPEISALCSTITTTTAISAGPSRPTVPGTA
jgi:hypothetical protein